MKCAGFNFDVQKLGFTQQYPFIHLEYEVCAVRFDFVSNLALNWRLIRRNALFDLYNTCLTCHYNP
jgi:hypothetical protein